MREAGADPEAGAEVLEERVVAPDEELERRRLRVEGLAGGGDDRVAVELRPDEQVLLQEPRAERSADEDVGPDAVAGEVRVVADLGAEAGRVGDREVGAEGDVPGAEDVQDAAGDVVAAVLRGLAARDEELSAEGNRDGAAVAAEEAEVGGDAHVAGAAPAGRRVVRAVQGAAVAGAVADGDVGRDAERVEKI